jgi:hypothetical protein
MQASRPVARPGSDDLPVSGEQVRNTRILLVPDHPKAGYDARQVDDLLLRVAAEMDAGSPAGPLIENATFRRRISRRRYDIDAVDWLLGQLLGCVELTKISADPWCGLAVSQLAPGEVSGLAERRQQSGEYFVEQCETAWRDFGQLPGTHLWWEKVGRVDRELRTADQQTLASERGRWSSRTTVSVGGRSFAWFEHTPDEPQPGVADFYARVSRDAFGHFTKTLDGRTQPRRSSVKVAELADEAGMPALYTSGHNFSWRAHSSIMFPDQRRLRFLVRGTGRSNAIMTAVDQIGNSVARYRIIDEKSMEIAVNPGWKLTDDARDRDISSLARLILSDQWRLSLGTPGRYRSPTYIAAMLDSQARMPDEAESGSDPRMARSTRLRSGA